MEKKAKTSSVLRSVQHQGPGRVRARDGILPDQARLPVALQAPHPKNTWNSWPRPFDVEPQGVGFDFASESCGKLARMTQHQECIERPLLFEGDAEKRCAAEL